MPVASCDEKKKRRGYLGEPPSPRPPSPAAGTRDTSVEISPDSMKQFLETFRRKTELAVIAMNVEPLAAISNELFGATRVEIVPDPEIEDSYSVVFSVETSGDPREVANRRREWYKRIEPILGENCGQVQLLIDITE